MFVGSLFGPRGTIIGLGLGLVAVGFSYWFSDRLAIAAAGATEVSATQAPQLHATVAELAQRAGIPMPRVYVSPSAQPNAFATGRSPRHAAVCVTRGLLDVLDLAEVKGVLDHELGHVKHRDILIGSVAAAAATGIQALTNPSGARATGRRGVPLVRPEGSLRPDRCRTRVEPSEVTARRPEAPCKLR